MLYCTDEHFSPDNNAPIGDEAKTVFLAWLFLRTEKHVGCSMGVWAMDSPESILVWNHYSGAKVKLKKPACCLPDRHLNSLHSLGAVTGITDVELGLL